MIMLNAHQNNNKSQLKQTLSRLFYAVHLNCNSILRQKTTLKYGVQGRAGFHFVIWMKSL